MGIRETLNENPRLTTGITAGIVVITLGVILWQTFGSSGVPTASGGSGKIWFTDDDGKNWFADDAAKIPPFDRNGKEAVIAHVYKCDGKTFVNHMQRYTKDAKTKLEAAIAKGNTGSDPTLMESITAGGLEYKAPGDKEWVKTSDPRYVKVITPRCSKPEEAEPVPAE